MKIHGHSSFANIKWLRDESPINICNSEKYSFVNKNDIAVILLIHNPTKDDVGNYTCLAEDTSHTTIDRISHHISLRSLRDLEANQSAKSTEQKSQATSARQPISFESFLKNMTIEEGTTTKFICSIRGPFTSAVWTKDGQVITANDRYIPGRTEGLVFLEIKNTNPSDSGNYVVCVSNNANDMSSNAQLNVYPNRTSHNQELNVQPAAHKGKCSHSILFSCVPHS